MILSLERTRIGAVRAHELLSTWHTPLRIALSPAEFRDAERRRAAPRGKSNRGRGERPTADSIVPKTPPHRVSLRQVILLLSSPHSWVVSIHELRSYGHFPTLREDPHAIRRVLSIMDGGDSPPLQHLVRYAAWWSDTSNANALDELEAAAGWYHNRTVMARVT